MQSDDIQSDLPGADGEDFEPQGLWKLESQQPPSMWKQVRKSLQKLRVLDLPFQVPFLVEEQPAASALGSEKARKLTVLVTGPVVVPGQGGLAQRMLWDDVAKLLLREEMVACPITVRKLDQLAPGQPPVIFTFIAAGGTQEWETERLMQRAGVEECLRENGLQLVGGRREGLEFCDLCLDSVDALLFVDKLHKYQLEESEKELIERLTMTLGPKVWSKAVFCLVNDGYRFPPVGVSSLGDFANARSAQMRDEVNKSIRSFHSQVKGQGKPKAMKPLHTIVDVSELYVDDNNNPVMTGSPSSSIDLMRSIVAVANNSPAYRYDPGVQQPSEEIEQRFILRDDSPPEDQEDKADGADAGAKAKQVATAKPAGPMAGPMGGLPGLGGGAAPPAALASQQAAWEGLVRNQRMAWQGRKDDAGSKGFLRSLWDRVSGSDLKWLPYVVTAQVIFFNNVILPLMDYYKEKSLKYAVAEYNLQKEDRARVGLQPPRGLEYEGVYIEEPWPDGEAYTQWLKMRKEQQMAAAQQQQQQQQTQQNAMWEQE